MLILDIWMFICELYSLFSTDIEESLSSEYVLQINVKGSGNHLKTQHIT